MDYWFNLTIFGLVFVVMAVFVLSAFQQSLTQPIYDAVNFNNPLMVLFTLIVVVVLAFGWMSQRQEAQQVTASLRRR
jgi:uncharacterized YccA/Bax inhibitor family protein